MSISNPRLPRAPDPAQPITLRGRLWNRLCDLVERYGVLDVSPPLYIRHGPGSTTIGINVRLPVWFRLAGTCSKYGMYTVNPLIAPSAPIDTTVASAFSLTDYGTPNTTVTWYALNVLESDNDGAVPHYLTVGGGYRPQDFQGTFWMNAKDGTPIYLFYGDNDDLCA